MNSGTPSSQTLARVSSDALVAMLAPCMPSDASASVPHKRSLVPNLARRRELVQKPQLMINGASRSMPGGGGGGGGAVYRSRKIMCNTPRTEAIVCKLLRAESLHRLALRVTTLASDTAV